MLDATLTRLAAERIRLELTDRQDLLTDQVRTISAEMSARGALRSGMTSTKLSAAIRQEAVIRAQLVWQIVARVISTQLLALDPAIAAEIKTFIEEQLRMNCSDFDVQLDNVANLLGRAPQAADTFLGPALARIYSEVDISLLSARTQQQATGTTTVNIYQPYGIVQTGAQSTATFSATNDNKTVVLNALREVQKVLATASDISDVDRREAIELVQDTTTELDKPTPNTLRIRSALSTLATTVQTMGSAAGAYQLLKGAAALLGVHLP